MTMDLVKGTAGSSIVCDRDDIRVWEDGRRKEVRERVIRRKGGEGICRFSVLWLAQRMMRDGRRKVTLERSKDLLWPRLGYLCTRPLKATITI